LLLVSESVWQPTSSHLPAVGDCWAFEGNKTELDVGEHKTLLCIPVYWRVLRAKSAVRFFLDKYDPYMFATGLSVRMVLKGKEIRKMIKTVKRIRVYYIQVSL